MIQSAAVDDLHVKFQFGSNGTVNETVVDLFVSFRCFRRAAPSPLPFPCGPNRVLRNEIRNELSSAFPTTFHWLSQRISVGFRNELSMDFSTDIRCISQQTFIGLSYDFHGALAVATRDATIGVHQVWGGAAAQNPGALPPEHHLFVQHRRSMRRSLTDCSHRRLAQRDPER
jgi:hypothetical protein